MRSQRIAHGLLSLHHHSMLWLSVVGLIVVLLAGSGNARAQTSARPTGEITVFAAASLTAGLSLGAPQKSNREQPHAVAAAVRQDLVRPDRGEGSVLGALGNRDRDGHAAVEIV